MSEPLDALLGFLRSGEQVFDGTPSHVLGHPTVMPFLAEALSRIYGTNRDRIYEEVDFGRLIGESNCVRTRHGDKIFFAQRRNRKGLTRFVKNRPPEPSSRVTVVLVQQNECSYLLRTAFIGEKTPPEPWDMEAGMDSILFWNAHALTCGFAETMPGTETTVCPWEGADPVV